MRSLRDDGRQFIIRPITRSDIPSVMEIERSSFDYPWSEYDFLNCLGHRDVIGMVAESQERIVGFMIYHILPDTIHVFNFAVHHNFRRIGIGSQMVGHLKMILNQQRREELMLEVCETNLAAQLFFRKHRFTMIDTLKLHYREEETDEDAYVFSYLNPCEKTVRSLTTTAQ